MDGRCRTCRWWEQITDIDDETGAPIVRHPDTGSCALAESRGDEFLHPESLAHAHDVESYSAWLSTDANFGCVQWQAKPASLHGGTSDGEP